MARTKRLVHHPEANTRPAVRRRTSDENPPEAITGDLNQPPPLSGENPTVSEGPDEGSSMQESPNAMSSSRASDTAIIHFDTEAQKAEEDERKLEEEYNLKIAAIRKRKEEAEQRRKDEEERIKKQEEERLRKEEEDRKAKEEAEKLQKEAEERRVKEEEERLKQEEARILEEQKKLEEERLMAEARESLNKEKEMQGVIEEQVQDMEISQEADTENQQVFAHSEQVPAHSEQTPKTKVLASRGVVTRSGVSKQVSSSRPKRKASAKGKGLAPSSSVDTILGSEQTPSKLPTVGTVHAHSGEPRQFTSPASKAHYESIHARRLNMERGFQDDFIEANPFIKDRLVAQDWAVIAAANRRANASLVREFYAEASQAKEPFVQVRGKVVDYSPSNLNRVLGRKAPEPCMFGQFLAKMSPADEDLILKEIAVEGRPWNMDGQRKCLYAGSLTTEAAVWFQFLRASVAPTSHDTTLSMHKCAMLYCLLTNRKINLGIVMHGAIYQARTRTKVILPLPCLITKLLTDAGVPTAEGDEWLDSTKNISIQTVKKMGRDLGEQVGGQEHPNVRIAEEHIVGNKVPTVQKKGSPLRPKAKGETSAGAGNPMTEILTAITALTYKVEILAAEQKAINRALESVWAYTRDHAEVVKRRYMAKDPVFAAQLPEFPEGICPTTESEDDLDEGSGDSEGDSSPTDTPTH